MLQMYNETSKQYLPLDDDQQIFNVSRDFQALHRFRILSRSNQLQAPRRLLLDHLQSTVNQLSNATQYIENIQSRVLFIAKDRSFVVEI